MLKWRAPTLEGRDSNVAVAWTRPRGFSASATTGPEFPPLLEWNFSQVLAEHLDADVIGAGVEMLVYPLL